MAVLKKDGYFDKAHSDNTSEYLLIANSKALVTSNKLECVLVGTPKGKTDCKAKGLSFEDDKPSEVMIGWSLRQGLLDIEWSMLFPTVDSKEGEGYFLISRPVTGKSKDIKVKHFKTKRFAMDKLKTI